MADTDPAVTAAARALIAHRWGSTRPDRLGREVASRAADLSPDVADLLFEALGGVAQRGASPDTPHLDEGDLL